MEERLRLEDLIARRAGERLGRNLSSDRIVIDVPERISFEIDIPILGDDGRWEAGAAYAPARHLFADRQGGDFPGSLRRISVSGWRDEETLAALGRIDFSEYLAPE
jgi:hypothetical protein